MSGPQINFVGHERDKGEAVYVDDKVVGDVIPDAVGRFAWLFDFRLPMNLRLHIVHSRKEARDYFRETAGQ